jgi:hypothetical protein
MKERVASMRRIKTLTGVLVLVLSLGAVVASSALAAAETLHLKYEGISLTPGHEVEGYDTGWSLESTEGNVSCSASETNEGFLGADETNNEKKDQISVTTTFGGFYSNVNCSSTVAGFSPEARGIWFNGNTDSPEVKGKFKLSTKGKGEYLTAGPGDTVVALQNLSDLEVLCFYEAKKLKGTLGPFPGSVYSIFSAQKVKLLKETLGFKSAATCPKHATVTTTVSFYIPLGGGLEAVLDGEVS